MKRMKKKIINENLKIFDSFINYNFFEKYSVYETNSIYPKLF